MAFERRYSALILASLVTVAGFVAATAYTQNRLARLDVLSSTIETDAVPSIAYLSQAALRLTRLSQLLDDLSVPGAKQTSAAAEIGREIPALQRDVDAYVLLPTLPGERSFWAELRADVDGAIRSVRRSIDADDDARDRRRASDVSEADAAVDRALGAVLATLDYDVSQTKQIARDVRSVRIATLRTVIALDAVASAISLIGLLAAYRAARGHDRLVEQHDALVAARVHELDCFAGRVAHDVVSPLGAVAIGLSFLAQSTDAQGRTYIERSQRALLRVQQLVDGLLTFARSGARPDPRVSCASDLVVNSVIADSSDAARAANIELIVESNEALKVRCSLGALTSIVQNLVWNAIKYMGNQSTRRIILRARQFGTMARLEVEDTGPGIPVDIQPAVFEAFVRGPHEVVGGTGLGLATVKRLVEAHGGSVGLESNVGVGSLFWVELPLASAQPVA